MDWIEIVMCIKLPCLVRHEYFYELGRMYKWFLDQVWAWKFIQPNLDYTVDNVLRNIEIGPIGPI